MSAEEDRCLACVCRFDEAGAKYCDDCGAGPFCRFCLSLRHRPAHEHGFWRKLARWLGWHRCAQCTEVAR